MVRLLALLAILLTGVGVAPALPPLAMVASSTLRHGHVAAVPDVKVPIPVEARLGPERALPTAAERKGRPLVVTVATKIAAGARQVTRRAEAPRLPLGVARAGRPIGEVTALVRPLPALADAPSPRRQAVTPAAGLPTMGVAAYVKRALAD